MSETATKADLLEREYARIIHDLVTDAVAPPIAQFQQTLVQRLDISAKSVSEATGALAKQSDQLNRTLGREIASQMTPVRDDVEAMNDGIQRVATRLDALDPEKIRNAVAESRDAVLQRVEASTKSVLEANDGLTKQTKELHASLGREVAAKVDAASQGLDKTIKTSAGMLKEDAGRHTAEVLASQSNLRKEIRAGRDELESLGTHIARTMKESDAAFDKRLDETAQTVALAVREEGSGSRDAARLSWQSALTRLEERFAFVQAKQDELDQQIGKVRAEIVTHNARSGAETNWVLRQVILMKRILIISVLVIVLLLLATLAKSAMTPPSPHGAAGTKVSLRVDMRPIAWRHSSIPSSRRRTPTSKRASAS